MSCQMQAVRELTGLVEGANALLSGSKGLETKYLSLPSYASQRLSLALEADPNAVCFWSADSACRHGTSVALLTWSFV